MCEDGSYVCDASDCTPEDPDVIIIADDAVASDGMDHLNLYYQSWKRRLLSTIYLFFCYLIFFYIFVCNQY